MGFFSLCDGGDVLTAVLVPELLMFLVKDVLAVTLVGF